LKFLINHHSLPVFIKPHSREASRATEVAPVGDVKLEYRRQKRGGAVKQAGGQVDGKAGQFADGDLTEEKQTSEGVQGLAVFPQNFLDGLIHVLVFFLTKPSVMIPFNINRFG
jgi:hypothetical protein